MVTDAGGVGSVRVTDGAIVLRDGRGTRPGDALRDGVGRRITDDGVKVIVPEPVDLRTVGLLGLGAAGFCSSGRTSALVGALGVRTAGSTVLLG